MVTQSGTRSSGTHSLRLPAGVAERRPSLWDIYRLEFAFYDRDSHRWQLFQEGVDGVTDTVSRHRTQIESVLSSLRKALAAVPEGTPFTRVDRERHSLETNSAITLSLAKILEEATTHPQIWQSYVDELIKSARHDALLDTKVCQTEGCKTLADLLQKIRDWPKNPTGNISLAPRDACLLISLLPILRHWDLYGAIQRARIRSETDTGLANSLWQDAGNMGEPAYCCHFIYSDGNGIQEQFPSITILKQLILTEAVIDDLTKPEERPINVALRDYFTYAFQPTNPQELTLYRFNSFFQDEIQRRLSAEAKADDPKSQESDHIYYFAYPIFSGLGRAHFLHIYARPHQEGATARDLWEAWQELHAQVKWPELRNVLVDELEEIDRARLRSRVSHHLKRKSEVENIPDALKRTDEFVLPLVANDLHLVLPIRCVCSGDQASGKELGFYPKVQEDSVAISGIPWRNLQVPIEGDESRVRCKGEMNHRHCWRVAFGESVIRWNDRAVDKLGPVHRQIVEGRHQRKVAQEREFARMFWESHEATRLMRKTSLENVWRKERKVSLAANRDSLIQALSSQSGSYRDRFAAQSVCDLFVTTFILTPEQFFEPLFYEKRAVRLTQDSWAVVEDTSDDPWLAAYHEVMGGTLHEAISEFIETDAVQLILHYDEDPESHLDGEWFASEAEQACSRIQTVLTAAVAPSDIATAIQSLSSAVLKFDYMSVSKYKHLSALRSQIQQIRNTHFRRGISGVDELRTYLRLLPKDEISVNNTKLEINICADAFDLEPDWSELVNELRSNSLSGKMYAAGFTVHGIAEDVQRRMPYSNATLIETCFLVGIPLDEHMWKNLLVDATLTVDRVNAEATMDESSGSQNAILPGTYLRKPGVLNTWGTLVGRWGFTFLLKQSVGEHGLTEGAHYSLPDCIRLPSVPHAEQLKLLIQNLIEPDYKFWTFYGVRLRGYKV